VVAVERLENGSYRAFDDPGEPVTDEPRLSITDEEGQFLAWLAHERRVLEIGTGLGVSTGYLRSAWWLETCDIDPWVHDNVWTVSPADVFHQDYQSARGPFDLVFIDGEHSTRQTKKDITFARSVCRGVIAIHDANLVTVRRALVGDWNVLATTHGIGTTWSWDG
jgi:predicted O-methyltransferase YrrM